MKPNHLMYLVFAATLLYACKSRQAKLAVEIDPTSKLRIEIIDPEALNLLDTTAKIEIIAKGFKWTEGPLYISNGEYLLFSDIPDNKIYKWKEGQGVSTFLTPSGNTLEVKNIKEPGSNGLILDAEGYLVLCQHGDRRIAKMTLPIDKAGPEFVSLADKFQGKRLNSPNDAVYHPNGDLYFTDPPYGLGNGIEDATKELDFQGVYRLKPDGRLDLFTKGLQYPNGIALSPDSKTLYVASSDSANYVWMQYELDSAGMPKSQRVFYEAHAYQGKNLGAPDGMKVNETGYIFASGPEGIWLFTPGAKLIAKLHTGQLTSNCAFSPGEKTLYMTCDDYVMRLQLKQ
ncbi:MAG: Gluconolactonase [Ferruginibacter sp.]|nr:Gluconolactonase [Ferruginibacter sp.]